MDRIFQYIDYRRYLADYYSEMKLSSSYFSYRWFAQKAGIKSPSLYKRVAEGERNISEVLVEQFIIGLGLSDNEAEYFRVLVAFNQASTAEVKQRNYSLMLTMADFVSAHQLQADEYTYLTQWYLPVLRELVTFFPFNDDFERLGKAVKPEITVRQAQSGIEQLVRMGFISKSSNGLYEQRDSTISCSAELEKVQMLARRSFNKQMISKAADSLDLFPVFERFATGKTMSISDACYDVLVQEYALFRERIAAIVEKDSGSTRVFQMNWQLFPLSDRYAERDEEQE